MLRQFASERLLQDLEALVDAVEQSNETDLVKTHRAFGSGGLKEPGGHEVTFLHLAASDAELEIFWEAARRADEVWGGRLASPRGRLRCLEAISYPADGGDGAEERDALGWHDDGLTVFTVVLALSDAGADFKGGDLEVVTPGRQPEVVADLRRGDAAVFRGFHKHRVHRVTQGQRRVIVAEWWLGEECSRRSFRPIDTEGAARRLLAVEPQCAKAHLVLAEGQRERMELEEVRCSLEAAVKIDNSDADVLVDLGEVCRELGDALAARKWLRAALRLGPEEAAATHQTLGLVLRDLGDLHGCLRCLEEARRLDPTDTSVYNNLAVTLSELGDDAGAERWYREALLYDPSDSASHYNLGSLRLEAGDFVAAERHLRAVLTEQYDDASAHLKLGLALASQGKMSGAKQCLREAQALDPTGLDPRLHMALNLMLHSRGGRDESDHLWLAGC